MGPPTLPRPQETNRETPVSPITPRIVTLLLCLAGFSFASLPAMAAKEIKRDLSKDFDDLDPERADRHPRRR